MTVPRTSSAVRGSRARQRVRRRIVLGLAAVVAIAVGAIAWGASSRDPYTIHLRLANAGQVVRGGLVNVAGVEVGRIRAVRLAPDGQADLRLEIRDERFVPLHRGTRASIRSVGQATITNRYVDLVPGPDSGAELASGSILQPQSTVGMVDLDAILSSLGPAQRRDVQRLIRNSGQIYAGSGARDFNAMLGRLDPALREVGQLAAAVVDDRGRVDRLIRTGAVAARAMADRSGDLEAAVAGTATTMRAVAERREHLAEILRRAPKVLDHAGRTTLAAAGTASALRPTLREIPAVQPGLRTLLRQLPDTLSRSRPAIGKLSSTVPPAIAALQAVDDVSLPLRTALTSSGKATDRSMDLLEGLRYYGPDLFLGVVNGLTGISSGPYTAMGHYVKLEFIQSPQTALGGALAPLLPGLTPGGALPGVLNSLVRQTNRCPGSNAPPAPDGSNPWYPKKGLCDPRQSMSGLVSQPNAFCFNATTCTGDRRSLEPDPDPVQAAAERRRNR